MVRAKLRSRWLLAALAFAIAVVLTGGLLLYTSQKHSLHQSAEATLLAAANLKVDQIVGWRRELQADAATAMDSPFFAAGVARWIASSQATDANHMLIKLRAMREPHRYHDILLVDSNGQVRSSASGKTSKLHEASMEATQVALRERRPVLTDIQAGTDDIPPHVDAIAPLFNRGDGDATVIGAIVLRADVRQFLYPLIQSWPTPSESAETLLVRRDGDAVLFLNDLRHQEDTAFKLRLPLTRTDVPAVMAVSGREGVAEGTDYRDIAVLTVLKPIPESLWFMVSKVDTAEILESWRFRSALILGLTLALILAVAAMAAVVWQNQAKAHYQALAEAQASRQESEERYRTTLMSVGDAVIATDAQGRVVMLNPVAEALTGWPQAEAAGRPLDEVFHIVNEDTRQPVESPVHHVLRDGTIVELANHTLLVARDGSEYAIADSSAPIRSPDGTFTGIVLVFRDQTAKRAAAAAVLDSQQELKAVFDSTPIMMCVLEQDGRIINANRAFLDTYGPPEAHGPSPRPGNALCCIHALDDPRGCGFGPHCHVCPLRLALEDTRHTGKPSGNIEYRPHDNADDPSAETVFLASTSSIDSSGQNHILLCLLDITRHRQAEAEREISIDLLRLMNSANNLHELIKDVTGLMQDWSACEAVGIRLRDGEDYPYFESRGFPPEFTAAENSLCRWDPAGELVRDVAGHPVLECMCGNVIRGRFDPGQPFFTPAGSFWTNSTSDLLATTSESQRQSRTCNRCHDKGYESVALIPLRFADETLGLLQFNDHRKNMFSPARIALFERLANSLATGLSQQKAVVQLQQSEERYRMLFSQMLEGFALHEIICDEQGTPVDYRFLQVNPAFEAMTGLAARDIIGKTVLEVMPNTESRWIETYGQVVMTGQPVQFEDYARALDRYFRVTAFRPSQGQFAVSFEDVTERKRAQECGFRKL